MRIADIITTLKKPLFPPREPQPAPLGVVGIATSALFGGALCVFGLAVGFVVGAFMLPIPVEFGGLPGYEGSGLFGSVLGVLVTGMLWILFRMRNAAQRTIHARMFAAAWLLFGAAVHFTSVAGLQGTPVFALLPLMISGVAAHAWERGGSARKWLGYVLLCMVVAGGIAVATLPLVPSLPPDAVGVPYHAEPFTVVTREVTPGRLYVAATRGEAKASILVTRDGSWLGRAARAVRLQRRDNTAYVVKNRNDYAFTYNASDFTSDLRQDPADQLADVGLALDVVLALRDDAGVKKAYDEELFRLEHHLTMTMNAMAAPPGF